MRLVAFSDLHLDAPFVAGGPTLARLRRDALRRSLGAICELVVAEDADALVCAGDLFEHERVTPDTSSFLRRSFAELAPRPVVLAPGNHDWYGPSSPYATVDWPDNVVVARRPSLTPHRVAGVTLWVSAHVAPVGAPSPLDGASVEGPGPHVGVFHGSELGGFAAQARSEPDKAQHAPFSAADIAAAGLDHALVGHYHRRVEGEHHTYPGNPAPLSFGDGGDGGAVVIDVAPDGSVDRRWVPVSPLDSHDLTVDLGGCVDQSEMADRVRAAVAGRRGLARVTVTGEVHPDAVVDLDSLGEVDHELAALVVRARELHAGYDLERIAAEPTVRGQFVTDVRAAGLDPEMERRVITTGLRALAGRADLAVA